MRLRRRRLATAPHSPDRDQDHLNATSTRAGLRVRRARTCEPRWVGQDRQRARRGDRGGQASQFNEQIARSMPVLAGTSDADRQRRTAESRRPGGCLHPGGDRCSRRAEARIARLPATQTEVIETARISSAETAEIPAHPGADRKSGSPLDISMNGGIIRPASLVATTSRLVSLVRSSSDSVSFSLLGDAPS